VVLFFFKKKTNKIFPVVFQLSIDPWAKIEQKFRIIWL